MPIIATIQAYLITEFIWCSLYLLFLLGCFDWLLLLHVTAESKLFSSPYNGKPGVEGG